MNLIFFYGNRPLGISCTNTNNLTQFLKNKNKRGFRFTEMQGPVQEESVSQIICNLPNKNGFDRISSKLLKRIEL